ncbi:MAG TPA: MmcQ/YjbR family DNA-binding protein [Reyranella sp.]
MAPRKLSLTAIRRAVSTLPGVEEGTSYGTPAWRHRGKLLARLHRDGESIVLKVGNETRDHLLQADSQTFFITDHYVGYPTVLARLDRLSAADLKKLLARAMVTKAKVSSRGRRPRDL